MVVYLAVDVLLILDDECHLREYVKENIDDSCACR